MPDDSVYAPFTIARHEDGSRIELGRGAMGITYRATDTQLGRTVALKVINATYLGDPGARQRFLAEARAAAQLHHANVAGVFQLRAEGEDIFYAMEFVEGETVDALVRRSGPLPSRLALRIILQASQGLAAADARGLIHRDIKPANLMLATAPAPAGGGIEHEEEDGLLVKVIDFGLAKNVGGNETGGGLTGGNVVGTPYFMSPEQISNDGGGTVDCRSDIYSLGVTLWYLLMGRPPFEGSQFQILSQHLQKRPPLEKLAGAGVPTEIVALIGSMLAKDREERPANHAALIAALKKLLRTGGAATAAPGHEDPSRVKSADETMAMPAVSTGKKASSILPLSTATWADEEFSIAVLPFKSSGGAKMEAFANGLGQDITTGLSRFRYLSVVARASATQLPGGDERGQGARYLLDGSVRQAGSTIRVSVQLIDAQSDAQLWAETYDRDPKASGIFAVQDDVAARIVTIAAESYGVLVHAMASVLRQRDDADLPPVAWQFQYFAYREQMTPAALAALRSRVERAVERDGKQSDLWASLAHIYTDEYAFGFGGDATSLDRALAAGRRAVELDRANQFALVALARIHFFRQDLAAFRPTAERAMALNPLNTDALGMLGLHIVHTGEFERGTAIVRRAMDLNPNHAGWMHFAPIWDHFQKCEYEQALERANRVDVPGFFWPYVVVASACGHLGRDVEAKAAVRDLLAIDPEFAAKARPNIASWHFASGLMEPILEGLRKAGLEIASDKETGATPIDPVIVSTSPSDSGTVRADEGFWVAVLPFRSASTSAEVIALAEGLSEEIVTGLSRFSYLRVIARGSTLKYANQPTDLRTVGKELGARYVMEGSLRQAGAKLRVAVQVVDTTSGAHLWAETYERDFRAEAIFEVQDDLVPRIVSTVADHEGVLPQSMAEFLRSKREDQLSPHEAMLRSFRFFKNLVPEEHAVAKRILENAVSSAPNHGECWALLSHMYSNDYWHAREVQPVSLDRALAAARRAVDVAPSNHLSHWALALALYLRRDFPAFHLEAQRAIELNRMDGSTVAFMGGLISLAGEWDRGSAISERASALNPNHAGWHALLAFSVAYHKRDYAAALAAAMRANMPENYQDPAARAAAYGQLGERELAQKVLRDLLVLEPDFASIAREFYGRWQNPELVEHLIEGWRKAGLEIPDEVGGPVAVKASDSGVIRADEGFWIAVLPFKYAGDNADLTALAEGLSEDVVTGLSRFSYLKVIARGSTLRYANQATDLRTVGKDLGARYVMEGSVRQAGTKLRLAVQLVDAVSGAHLWAENYERAFSSETVFELQDDLVPRIVSTIADTNGILPRSMSEVVRSRPPEQLSPYEAVLRSFGYFERVTAEDLAAARAGLESAVQKAPAYAEAWAMLALLGAQEYGQGFQLQADSLGSASTAARRAVELAPSNHLAHYALAQVFFFQKEFQSFRNAADRAIALNPMDGNSIAFVGELLSYAGDLDRGLALAGRAKQLNPNHPGWYWYADNYNAFRQGDDRGALNFVLKANLPGHWGSQVMMAAARGHLGEHEAAAKAVRELLKIRPDFVATMRSELGKWFDPVYRTRLIDGLHKAGLEIPDQQNPAAQSDGAAVAIAVLPFADLSPEKNQAHLCEGMAEEIMNALVQVEGIRVASRSSAFRAQQAAFDLPEIARALSVGHVLEGSVRTSGSRLRVTAQLTDVTSGFQVWSERFDREAADIFAVQDEIATGVMEAVKARLAPGSNTIPTRPQVRNLEAYQHFLEARHYRYTKNDHLTALRAYEKAVALDPSHAPSWVGVAETSMLAAWYSLISATEAIDRATQALAAAARLHGESAEASYARAGIAFVQRDWQAWDECYRRSLELAPSYVPALGFIGLCQAVRNHLDEALVLFQRTRELDPLAPYPFAITGAGLLSTGRVEESIPYFDQALVLERENSLALWNSGVANIALERYERGIDHLERATSHTRRSGFILGVLGWALATAGRTKEAARILTELRARPALAPTVVSEAWLLAALGDKEGAFEVLARAEAEFQPFVCLTRLPAFDPLRADPRFTALEKRLGLKG